MAVRSKNVHYELARIQTRHWQRLAQRSGVDGTWEAMQALLARAEPAIMSVQTQLPADFPERTAQTIFDGLRSRIRAWETGLVELS